jgi:chitinase
VEKNIAPTVKLLNPRNNRSYTAQRNIHILASANSRSGTIEKVDFYNGAPLIGTQYLSPYAITWKNLRTGNYTLKAVATDNNGLSTTSAPGRVSVRERSKSGASSRPLLVDSISETASINNQPTFSDNPPSLKVLPNPVSTTLNISIRAHQQNTPVTI